MGKADECLPQKLLLYLKNILTWCFRGARPGHIFVRHADKEVRQAEQVDHPADHQQTHRVERRVPDRQGREAFLQLRLHQLLKTDL